MVNALMSKAAIRNVIRILNARRLEITAVVVKATVRKMLSALATRSMVTTAIMIRNVLVGTVISKRASK